MRMGVQERTAVEFADQPEVGVVFAVQAYAIQPAVTVNLPDILTPDDIHIEKIVLF